MIDCEVKIIADCEFCEKEVSLENDHPDIFHDECRELFDLKDMIKKMKDILDKKEWEDTNSYTGFKSEEAKDAFMKGIKHGMEHAFFWYAVDSFGDEGHRLFEEIAGWK